MRVVKNECLLRQLHEAIVEVKMPLASYASERVVGLQLKLLLAALLRVIWPEEISQEYKA